MRKKYHFFIVLFLSVIVSSCSKDGLTGPEGPAGVAGAVGAAGKDGSIIYSGNGAPQNSLGAVGDYYLDKSTGNLYGPKLATGWNSPLTLIGATGTNGTNGSNGSTTLSGTGIPSTSIGANGDYYLDKTNYLLYGPKVTSGWGIPILLKGADGTQGPAGAAGKDGSIIYSGNGVPSTAIGVNGDYYLDKTTGNLYGPKTTAGWGVALVLRGTNGTNGTNGVNGSTTISGAGAPDNSLGAMGDYYLDRRNYLLYGPKNTDGWGAGILLRGADGAQGPMGPAGKDGSIIYSGETAPDPALGVAGDFYISRLPVALYGPKTDTFGWGIGTNLKGNDGNTVLNGVGVPSVLLGVNGDFYINLTTYDIYGPKTTAGWGAPTSLKGGNGAGNENLLFETPDNATFSWGYEDAMHANLRMHRAGNYNDSTSVFQVPVSALATAQNSVLLVYVREVAKGWRQMVEGEPSTGGLYSRNKITTTSASARVLERNGGNFTYPSIDKVRLILVPYTNSGTISAITDDKQLIPMGKLLQKLSINEENLIRLK